MRNTMVRFLTLAGVSLAAVCSGALNLRAAEPAKGAAGADEQAVRAACRSYVDAMNKGDLAGILGYWAEDADYVNDSGESFNGHTALEKLFKQNLPSLKGKKFAFEIKSLRMIAPGVALEDGVATISGADEDEQMPGTRYSAVWTRSGDKWRISSVRDLGDVSAAAAESSPLKQLAWLVGEWRSIDSDAEVTMSCSGVLEDKFLKQKYEVRARDGQPFTVVNLIGWDPTTGQIHSWFFDSRGGFGEGAWQHEGNSWNITASGVVADGRVGSATNIWKYVDDNNVAWISKDRSLEGLPMPDSEVKFVRQEVPKNPAGEQASQ